MLNKKSKEEKYNRLVEVHNITNFDSLLDIIKIDTEDLRENFIFRGLKKSSYELIPSSLREDNKINEFITKSEFNFNFDEQRKFGIDNDKIILSEKKLNSNNFTKHSPKYKVHSIEELQFKREIYVLLKFLDYADKIGLKIKASTSVRRWIHNHLSYENKLNDIWPKPEFYEIISLAQHHELPTRALDWTYDFKVALYFAVSNVLEGNKNDCILWAFNYKLFEDAYNEEHSKKDKLVIYRPEYSSNSNMKAQKGLFTFITSTNYDNIDDKIPFDKAIINYLIELKGLDEKQTYYKLNEFQDIKINDNERIFHKFIISGDLKPKILKELYLDGYAHENLFPNYSGVVQSIKNRAKLDNILNDINRI